jgi:erythromycin esterase-like protein
MEITQTIVHSVKQNAQPIHSLSADASWFYEALPELREAEFVLIGEATHGTHDFYRLRAEITKRLIADYGFQAVAIEGDWPDTYRVNRYVRGDGNDPDAEVALTGFKRFPTWMWRNADVLDFVGWLRFHNDSLSDPEEKTGFYGMDLYSLYTSIEAVIAYLTKLDPAAAERARERYSCFDELGRDGQVYAYLASDSRNCERQVVEQLLELQRNRVEYLAENRIHLKDDLFNLEQNARLVKNAEQYYRTMGQGPVASWNLRDRHMVESLKLLRAHLSAQVKRPKIVVWAHNSHLGDAHHTEMSERGEWNVGELIRKEFGDRAFLIGFTTYAGTVTAASRWDGPAERKTVRKAMLGSYEDLFHRADIPRFVLNFRQNDLLRQRLKEPRLERAIGVLYRPDTERYSHYFYASLSRQFDAVFHLDETRAVEPLEKTAGWVKGEFPETYPSAL